jgi:integrase
MFRFGRSAREHINAEVMFALRVMDEIGDAVRLQLKREGRLRLPKTENRGKALTPEEEAALLEAALVPEVIDGEKMDLTATRSPVIHPAIMLALNTTMRESEIRRLRWNQVAFVKRIITVGKDKKFKLHFLTGFLIRRPSPLPGCPFLF